MTAPKNIAHLTETLKDEIIEAVLLCDFSQIIQEKFRVGDSLHGLSDIIQAKQTLIKETRYGEDLLRRRAIQQLQRHDVKGALNTLEHLVKP